MQKIRIHDLSIKDKILISSYKNIFENFLKEGQFILGSEVENFEKKISQYIKKKFTVGVSSGTNAIYLALRALDIKKNDHILVPCLSWLSTFTATERAGAIPVGVDINDDLSISIESLKKRFTKKTKALLLVHFSGLIDQMDGIINFCKEKKIKLIEDGAQAFGTIYNNRPTGSFGDLACFSMNPMKVFSGIGDAGTVSTNDKFLFNKIKALRYAGTINKEYAIYSELNHKIDTLDALILIKKLKTLKILIGGRIKRAKLYDKLLNNPNIKKPKIYTNFQHNYYSYTITVNKRDKLKKFLERNNVETKIYHPYLICDHPGLKNSFNERKKFPNASRILKKILSLPIHQKITKKNILKINQLIEKFYNENK